MKDVTCAGILHYGNNYYLQITSDPLLAMFSVVVRVLPEYGNGKPDAPRDAIMDTGEQDVAVDRCCHTSMEVVL